MTPEPMILLMASLPDMPTLPTVPVWVLTNELPPSDLIREAAPAPAAVINTCEPMYCEALLLRSPLMQGMPWSSLIQPSPP